MQGHACQNEWIWGKLEPGNSWGTGCCFQNVSCSLTQTLSPPSSLLPSLEELTLRYGRKTEIQESWGGELEGELIPTPVEQKVLQEMGAPCPPLPGLSLLVCVFLLLLELQPFQDQGDEGQKEKNRA